VGISPPHTLSSPASQENRRSKKQKHQRTRRNQGNKPLRHASPRRLLNRRLDRATLLRRSNTTILWSPEKRRK